MCRPNPLGGEARSAARLGLRAGAGRRQHWLEGCGARPRARSKNHHNRNLWLHHHPHPHATAVAEHEHEHERRMLPPLSKGWAYGGPAGSRKEATDVEENKAAAVHEPDAHHRVLPPLSKGWAYGGPAGSRKDVDTQGQQEGNKGT